MTALKLTLFALFWITFVYLINCLIARKFKKIEIRQALLYTTSVGMLGVFGEVFVGHVYSFLFGEPLWLYHVLPIHNGFTSQYAPVIWGILGFHLYLLHGTLTSRKAHSINRLAFYFAGEAIIIELMGNYSFQAVFHQYIFYYFPPDLWHLTSVQTLPFYLAAGFVVTRTLKRLKAEPVFFTLMATGLAGVLVFMS
ncbi:MAG: hypothetical protein JWO41_210 [Candidatus Saccharibacteria bacterium]|nr:hypothetical protein [Candidatus Saccharibacteria bacterium]